MRQNGDSNIAVSLAFLRVQSQLRYDRYRENLKEFYKHTIAPILCINLPLFSPPLLNKSGSLWKTQLV